MDHMINRNIPSIEQMTESVNRRNAVNNSSGYAGPSFADILQQKRSIDQVVSDKSQVVFSKHAGQRLEQRDIRLSDEQMMRLEEGTNKAFSKGIKESLVLIDDLAFIVNTKNRTVITAMDQGSSQDNIYTNIDGAVIV